MAGLRTRVRYPEELLIKCRLEVLACGENGSMPFSADTVSASHSHGLGASDIPSHSDSSEAFDFGALLRFAFATTCDLLALLSEQTRLSPSPRGLLLPRFRRVPPALPRSFHVPWWKRSHFIVMAE